MSLVSAVAVRDSVHEAVNQAMELANWRNFIPSNGTISLKPNLGWDMFFPGCVTSPWVVEGVILTIRDHVEKIVMVESDQVLVNMNKAWRESKMDRLCAQYDIDWINMSEYPYETIKLDDAFAIKEVMVPEILMRSTMVTLPCLKTHNKTTITGAIKNQWGCLPKLRHSYHLEVHGALADINRLATPKFAVMDGTVGLEGNSPKSGIPRVADMVLASGDFISLDCMAARFMGFDPNGIEHIQNCAKMRLGNADESQIELAGDIPRDTNLHFVPAQHNAVSWLELVLRKGPVKPLVFDTPLFKIMCWGASMWYWLWFYALGIGVRRRDEILNNTRYGAQWR